MPHRRRYIKPNAIYAPCFRARNTLPLVAYQVIDVLIESALARAQRNGRLDVCHDIWNGSHTHMIVRAGDAEDLVRFMGELQKRITDSLKRLCGLEYAQIWEGRVNIAEIADLDEVKKQIAYLYANPAQDNLVDSIEDFPGLSSWREYQTSPSTIDAVVTKTVSFVLLNTIPEIKARTLTPDEDRALVRHLRAKNRKRRQQLIRRPNVWMKSFGITSPAEVAQINEEIVQRVRTNELMARAERLKTQRSVLGVKRLRSDEILAEHRPKKNERKVFVYSSDNRLRLQIIAEHDEFDRLCKYCYERWRIGDFTVEWPPGAFRPRPPLHANVIV